MPKGTKYPTDLDEVKRVRDNLIERIGKFEEQMLKRLEKYPHLSPFVNQYGLYTSEKIMKFCAVMGATFGMHDSDRQAFIELYMSSKAEFSDIYFICLSNRNQLTFYVDPLSKGCALEATLLDKDQRESKLDACLEYWRSSVSDVMLSEISEEESPDKVIFDDEIERVYSENVARNWDNFHISHGKDGREVVTRRARIQKGEYWFPFERTYFQV